MKDFILEIGTEELPARYINDVLLQLQTDFGQEFKNAKIEYGPDPDIDKFGTPRRLVIFIKGVAEKQNDEVKQVVGSTKKVAYDQAGKPTPAAFGFAKTNGVQVKDLTVIQLDKGEYVCITKEIKGKKNN